MPATPKKPQASPVTPTRASRRLRHESPEVGNINPLTSPTKSARKRALDFTEDASETKKSPKKTPQSSATKASPRSARRNVAKSKQSPIKFDESPVKNEASPLKAHESPAKAKESPVKSEASPLKAHESPVKAKESLVKAKASPVVTNEPKTSPQKKMVKKSLIPVSSKQKTVDVKKSPNVSTSPQTSPGVSKKPVKESPKLTVPTVSSTGKASPFAYIKPKDTPKAKVSITSPRSTRSTRSKAKGTPAVETKKSPTVSLTPRTTPAKPTQELDTSLDKKSPKHKVSLTPKTTPSKHKISLTPKSAPTKSTQELKKSKDATFSTADKDKFFSRVEMEDFLNQQEKGNQTIDLFGEFDDDVGDADYHYDDFFGNANSKEEKKSDKFMTLNAPESDSSDDEDMGELNKLKPLDAPESDSSDDKRMESVPKKKPKAIEFEMGDDSDDEENEEIPSDPEFEDDNEELEDESEGYEEEPKMRESRNKILLDEAEDESEGEEFEDEEEDIELEDDEEMEGAEGFEDQDIGSDMEEQEEDVNASKKRVHFELDSEDDEPTTKKSKAELEMEAMANESDGEEEQEPTTTFEVHQKHLKHSIAEFEQQNLAPRSWELGGEVAAHQREQDGLLTQYIEVDYRATQAPIIDENINTKIESIIKQRIKDKNFDDVVRTKRVDESLQTYRARTTIDDIERKSLMQMYEEEYRKKIGDAKENNGQGEEEQKLDVESEAIQTEMNAIFSKLDTLCHSNYRPTEVQGEPEVIINKLAVNVEEVGQTATTAPDEELLAPEEVSKHTKFVPKSKEERSKTDKLRERRKKKKKQKVIIRKMGKTTKAENKEKPSGKDKKFNFKSNNVFDQLQTTIEREKTDKTTKLKKKKQDNGSKIKASSAKL